MLTVNECASREEGQSRYIRVQAPLLDPVEEPESRASSSKEQGSKASAPIEVSHCHGARYSMRNLLTQHQARTSTCLAVAPP
jgi:hypothetical protein